MEYREIVLPYKMKKEVLALGGQSKAGFCFARGKTAYLADTGGDLADIRNFKKFERDIKKLQRKLKINPRIIACDMHPDYISTKLAHDWAENSGVKVKAIQHHEAHAASCMADNNIRGRVIGVTFDGTGFGTDNKIWGGEFFIGGVKGFKRAAHLRYVPMPGGEACVREPWRMGFSYLRLASLGELGTSSDIASSVASSAMTGRKWTRNDILGQMIDKNINSPLTSSMGRLFDGVSALAGICEFAGYEGEAAIKLEKAMPVSGFRFKVSGKYKFNYSDEDGIIIIDWAPLVRGIVKDLKRGVKKSEISLKFHKAVCGMIKETCNLLKKRYKIKKVCLSGGVFQNNYLKNCVKPLLENEGFEVYLHNKTPAHDGGIALGQAVLAGV